MPKKFQINEYSVKQVKVCYKSECTFNFFHRYVYVLISLEIPT